MTHTIHAPLLDLDQTLNSGQVFRFRKVGDRYFVCVRDNLFWLRQNGEKLEFGGVDEAFVRRFLDLDYDLEAALRRISRVRPMRPAVRACRGMRILQLDYWECLVSFICSTRSNIPKIKRSLNLLSACHGRRVHCEGESDYAFPAPGSLCDIRKLKSSGIGYRAEYLFETSRLCTNGLLESIARLPYAQAREELKKFPGVGDKVADCVCLFSMRFREAFPVDVWVQRAMLDLFPGCGKNEKQVRQAAMEIFGPDAGYAEQYLFQYWRIRAGKAAIMTNSVVGDNGM